VRRAAFLDRDGVINRKAPEGAYIISWGEMEFLPGVVSAVKQLNAADYRVIVVTNQRCVAKGLITPEQLEAMNRRICDQFAAEGAIIDAIYYCPHDFHDACSCRKPNPGMLLAASRERQIDLSQSWMIGDSDSDIQAGISAGCRTARLTETSSSKGVPSDVIARSLPEAVDAILEVDHADTSEMPQALHGRLR
jgi:D-glycero-D-manno-heptose 1,7-bisphosphate phosphatase